MNIIRFLILILQAFFPLGAIFGGLFAYPAAEILGRHPSLIIGGIPTISGWLMITYAWLFDTNHQGFLALLLLGRFFTGFAAGWSIFCVSVSSLVPRLSVQSRNESSTSLPL